MLYDTDITNPGSDCGQLLRVPAISGLDGPFASRRGSHRRFAYQYGLRPPPPVRGASPSPRLDRPASGRVSVPAPPLREAAPLRNAPYRGRTAIPTGSVVARTGSAFSGCGTVGFPSPPGMIALKLGTDTHSTANDSRLNGERRSSSVVLSVTLIQLPEESTLPRSRLFPTAASRTFHRTPVLLFNFRSSY